MAEKEQSDESKYNINKNVAYGFLKLIDIERIRDDTEETWFNQTLCTVNDCVVRLGVIQCDFHSHHHDNENEFFYVVSGTLFVDLEDQTVQLGPKQGFTVPRRVRHRTRAPERTAMLMIEGAGVKPKGDAA